MPTATTTARQPWLAPSSSRWPEYRALPERGHALLLLGQAKIALGDPSGLDAVRSARDVFAELGMRPALAEAEALLEGEVAAEA